jgi:hypothetical protein
MGHPTLFPPGDPITVCWLRNRAGRCRGKEYYDEHPECRASLLAQARQYALNGRVSKVPENGHQLQDEFSDLYELKPGDHRFMGFRDGTKFFLTMGAPKKIQEETERGLSNGPPTPQGVLRGQGDLQQRRFEVKGDIARGNVYYTYKISDTAPQRLEVNWLERELPDPEDQRKYARERVVIAVTEAIADAMEKADLRRADVAAKLGKGKAQISQVLSGRRNMTLHTLGDVLWACGQELDDLVLSPLGAVDCSHEQAWEWFAQERSMGQGRTIEVDADGETMHLAIAGPIAERKVLEEGNADLAMAA